MEGIFHTFSYVAEFSLGCHKICNPGRQAANTLVVLHADKIEVNNLRNFIVLFIAVLLMAELINQFSNTSKVSFIPALFLVTECLKFFLSDTTKQSPY
jgi:hypothetical protein